MYQRVYDSIAVIIRKIEEAGSIDNSLLEKFRSYDKKSVQRLLWKELPILFEEDGSGYKEIGNEQLDAWDMVDSYIQRCQDPFALLYLLIQLDLAIEKRVQAVGEIAGEIQVLESLNNNVPATQITIIPQMESFWGRNNRGRQHSYHINRLLKNIMYLDEQVLFSVKVKHIKHIILPSPYFIRSEKRGVLRIGCSFVSRNLHLKTSDYIRDGVKYFSVDGGEEDHVLNVVKDVLQKAKEEQVDILFFPEMIGSDRINQQIKRFLQESVFDLEEYPMLIALPSVWKKHQNSVMLLTGDGEEVCIQQKQYPFDGAIQPDGDTMLEDIWPDETLYLIHCRGLGRMAVMICKDFLVTEYLNMLLEILRVSLILVPSMTTGEYDFKNNIHACEHADCCVIQANCCSAQWMVEETQRGKLDICGYCLKSGKNQNKKYGIGQDKITTLEKPEKCKTGNCEEGCLIWQDFYYKRASS